MKLEKLVTISQLKSNHSNTATSTFIYLYQQETKKSSTLILKLKSKVLAAHNNHKG